MGSQLINTDKIYCVYNAANEELVREHAMQGGFPANVVSKVSTIINPITAERFVWSKIR